MFLLGNFSFVNGMIEASSETDDIDNIEHQTMLKRVGSFRDIDYHTLYEHIRDRNVEQTARFLGSNTEATRSVIARALTTEYPYDWTRFQIILTNMGKISGADLRIHFQIPLERFAATELKYRAKREIDRKTNTYESAIGEYKALLSKKITKIQLYFETLRQSLMQSGFLYSREETEGVIIDIGNQAFLEEGEHERQIQILAGILRNYGFVELYEAYQEFFEKYKKLMNNAYRRIVREIRQIYERSESHASHAVMLYATSDMTESTITYDKDGPIIEIRAVVTAEEKDLKALFRETDERVETLKRKIQEQMDHEVDAYIKRGSFWTLEVFLGRPEDVDAYSLLQLVYENSRFRLEAQAEEKQTLERTIADLKSQMKAQDLMKGEGKTQKERAEKEKKKTQIQAHQLQDRIKALEEQLKKIRAEHAEKEKASEKKTQAVVAENEQLKAALQQETECAQAEIQRIKVQAEQTEKRLQQQMQDLRAKLRSLEAANHQSRSALGRKQKEEQEAKQRGDSLSQQIKMLTEEIEQRESKVRVLERALTTQKEENTQVVQSLEKTIQELKAALERETAAAKSADDKVFLERIRILEEERNRNVAYIDHLQANLRPDYSVPPHERFQAQPADSYMSGPHPVMSPGVGYMHQQPIMQMQALLPAPYITPPHYSSGVILLPAPHPNQPLVGHPPYFSKPARGRNQLPYKLNGQKRPNIQGSSQAGQG